MIVNLESQVCSLDLAKRLKELGIKQDSLFWYADDDIIKVIEKKGSKFIRNLKLLGYSFLFVAGPELLIYQYTGPIPSIICSISILWGQLSDNIIDWCMEKF
jgi:hypothetical protein